VPSREHHVLSDLSDPDNTPPSVIAKDQADGIHNVVPHPVALAAGVPGLPQEPGVTHPPCKGGDIYRPSDPLASNVHPNEPGLSTTPDDKNSTLLSESIPSQFEASPANHKRPDALSQEQADLVNVAQEAMTPAQQNLVNHCKENGATWNSVQ
jgi:hypothetical protein